MSACSSVVLAFLAGLLVATATTPVGVSGAVFLLPIQLDVLHVPSPAVTPTNLLYNVVATPGGLLRHRRTGALGGEPTARILAGLLLGVVLGTVARVETELLAAAERDGLDGARTWLTGRGLTWFVAASGDGPPSAVMQPFGWSDDARIGRV